MSASNYTLPILQRLAAKLRDASNIMLDETATQLTVSYPGFRMTAEADEDGECVIVTEMSGTEGPPADKIYINGVRQMRRGLQVSWRAMPCHGLAEALVKSASPRDVAARHAAATRARIALVSGGSGR